MAGTAGWLTEGVEGAVKWLEACCATVCLRVVDLVLIRVERVEPFEPLLELVRELHPETNM